MMDVLHVILSIRKSLHRAIGDNFTKMVLFNIIDIPAPGLRPLSGILRREGLFRLLSLPDLENTPNDSGMSA